ncbi:11998_t:CDS:2, partial [Acaulospora colombiana]
MALSKLYAISAVYTLNARDDLRNWWGAARSYDISRQTGSGSRPQHSSKDDPHRSIAMKIHHPRYPSQPQTTTIEIRKETRVDGDPSMDMSPIKSKVPYD